MFYVMKNFYFILFDFIKEAEISDILIIHIFEVCNVAI